MKLSLLILLATVRSVNIVGVENSTSNIHRPSIGKQAPDLPPQVRSRIHDLRSVVEAKKMLLLALVDDKNVEFDSIPDYVHRLEERASREV